MSDETKDDIQGLIAKRDELLGQVRKLKTKIADLEAERDTANARADTAEGDLRRVRLDDPVEAMLSDLFTIKLRHALPELRDHFDFSLGEDGTVRFTDKEGQPVTLVQDKREAGFNAADIREALLEHGGFDEILRAPGVGGGGKPPNSSGRGVLSTTQKPEKVAPSFGLR